MLTEVILVSLSIVMLAIFVLRGLDRIYQRLAEMDETLRSSLLDLKHAIGGAKYSSYGADSKLWGQKPITGGSVKRSD